MLKVKTILKESTIPNAGLGLFAAEFIPQGTIIWELNPLIDVIIQTKDLPQLSELEKSYIDKYGYREGGEIILCADDGRFINHSFQPNMYDFVNETGSYTIALRDIQEGEELTSNYQNFDADFILYKHLLS